MNRVWTLLALLSTALLVAGGTGCGIGTDAGEAAPAADDRGDGTGTGAALTGTDARDERGDPASGGAPSRADAPASGVDVGPDGDADGGPAVIRFDRTSHDFGERYNTEVLKTRFEFMNEGGSDLVIERLKPNCTSCTATAYTKDPVPPGGEGYIDVQLTSDADGRRRKWIDVYSNGTESGRPTRIHIQADFKAWFWIEPDDHVSLGRIRQGEQFSPRTVRLEWLAERAMEVERISVQPEGALEIEERPIDEGGRRGVEVEVRFVDSEKMLSQTTGSFANATITFHTNSRELGDRIVRLNGSILEEVIVQPRVLAYRADAARRPPVNLAGPPGSDLEVEGYECTLPHVEVEMTRQKAGAGEVFRFRLVDKPDVAVTEREGELIIRTNFERKPVFTVPVKILE